jgi:menaquinone-9 beta-reductase
MTTAATLAWSDLSARTWDAVVVGAGPAGSVAARQLARLGLVVLLVDKAAFPRWKVCGCCLNGRALATLDSVGLADLASMRQAIPLTQTRIAALGADATIPLAQGMALSRTTLDSALVDAAVNAGVHFLPDTLAAIGGAAKEDRAVLLRQPHRETRVLARVVLAADGLAGRALAEVPRFLAVTQRTSRIGVGTVIDIAPAFYRRGTIFLACGLNGYLGLVQLEGGRVDLAGALDPAGTRSRGGPGAFAAAILSRVGWPPIPGIEQASWRGTVALTKRPACLADERLFVLGDAAGYVEPFTGEGMAWAIASAVAVTPLAAEAASRWRAGLIDEWTRTHQQCVGRRQRICEWVARGLRHPRVVQSILKSLSWWPGLATPIIRRLNSPVSPLEGIAS